jgi:integrase
LSGLASAASVKKGIRAAGTRVGMAVSPYDFRHSAAVWMAKAGVQVKRIADYLGHEDSRIMERVYARFRPAYQRVAAFGAGGRCFRQEGGVMVGATGIEPVTPRV